MGFIGHALKDGIQYGKYLMGLGACKCHYRSCNWSIQQKYDVTTGKFSLMSMILVLT